MTSTSVQPTGRMAGILLMVVPLAFIALFTALQIRFEYPDILRKPTGYVLEQFAAGGPSLGALWYGMLAAAVAFIPLSVLTGRLFPERRDTVQMATTFGILAGLVQAIGLSRWVFLVPHLAAQHQGESSTEGTREAVRVVFEGFNQFAGVGIGEHLGYFFTGMWTLLIARDLRPYSRHLSISGMVLSFGVLAGMLEATGAAWASVSTAVSYLLWAVWMAAFGVQVLRGRFENASVPAKATASPVRTLALSLLTLSVVGLNTKPANAQPRFTQPPQRELMIHGFRSPSIGLEYRSGPLGYHLGYYPTIIDKSDSGSVRTTNFLKLGVTAYLLPVKTKAERLSEVFLSVAYVRGQNNGWGNGLFIEPGFRWAVWKGLDLRLGIGLLVEENHKPRLNPTPGISWTIKL